jgi:hypothetical protein
MGFDCDRTSLPEISFEPNWRKTLEKTFVPLVAAIRVLLQTTGAPVVLAL